MHHVNNFYKGVKNANRVGNGTTADAIRYELRTAQRVGGKLHTQKGEDMVRGLGNWLRGNPGGSASDRSVAQAMLDDLTRALGGR